jgi:hypothetical protein
MKGVCSICKNVPIIINENNEMSIYNITFLNKPSFNLLFQ